MNDKIEAVARAISKYTFALISGVDDCGEWDEMSKAAQNVYREAAEAAIAAGEGQWPNLNPGQSVKLGRAWDGAYYVGREQSTPGDWFNVKRTIAYGDTVEAAWAAEQMEQR